MLDRFELEILEHREVAPGHWELVLPRIGALAKAVPGQFVTLLPRDRKALDPFLRRPFSIYRADGVRWSVLYRVVGRGTSPIGRSSPGGDDRLLRSTWTGFLLRDLREGAPVALIGGGVGVPPLFFLSQCLLRAKIVPEVYVGFASSAQVVAVDEWRAAASPPKWRRTTEARIRGFVTEIAADAWLEETSTHLCVRPHPMLRAVARLAPEHGVECSSGDGGVDGLRDRGLSQLRPAGRRRRASRRQMGEGVQGGAGL